MLLLPPEIVAGVITLWYSSVGSIPPGWALCDGNNGTPDLRDKFIQGAGFGVSPGDTGGSAAHTHEILPDSIALEWTNKIIDSWPTTPGVDTIFQTHAHTGSTGPQSDLTTYSSYVYIMFLG